MDCLKSPPANSEIVSLVVVVVPSVPTVSVTISRAANVKSIANLSAPGAA